MKVCKFIRFFSLILSLVTVLSCISCGSKTGENTVTCYNGKFVGSAEKDTGVLSFKGIPYAKSPTGERRWKAPESVDASNKTYKATEFGYSSIQYACFSEDITTEVSEDCLTLNIWTADTTTKDKAVMVFFHGGSFAWGGTSESLYNGQYIVNEHPDVIVVTCNYRVGMMGFIDLSGVPGGEEYTDSTQLGLLDAIESLRWIKQNIANFGGNPDNVTIFGESAGGGLVSCLLATDYAGELFQRVIAESGALNQTCASDDENSKVQAETLMELAGATCMDDLLKLTEEDLIELNEKALDEYGTCLNDLYSFPMRGGVVAEDAYAAIEKAKAKGVDVMIGSNEDEMNYWIAEMGGKEVVDMTDEELEEALYYYYNELIPGSFGRMYGDLSEEGKAAVDAYLAAHTERTENENKAKLCHEYGFRASALKMADRYVSASGTGKTYVYLFCKDHAEASCIGAAHAAELTYVFHNLNETGFTGSIDKGLADEMCQMWVNFAKTGDPSTETTSWTQYNAARSTMVFGNDCTCTMVDDPLSEERELDTKYIGDLYIHGGNGM